jgi:hypothetical protein
VVDDYEIWAPANWIYYPQATEPQLFGLRLNNGAIRQMDLGQPFVRHLRQFDIEVPAANALIVSMPWTGSCLRVLDGTRGELPSSPDGLIELGLSHSNVDRIEVEAPPPTLPREIFGEEPPHRWCYYFQKAELARQREDWPRVAALGDEARERGYAPTDRTEWLPFIEGYLYVGRYEQARDLASHLITRVPESLSVFCAMLHRVERDAPTEPGEIRLISSLRREYDCPA